MISFPCPRCRKILKASEEKVGAVSKCPNCKTPVRVPEAFPYTPSIPKVAEQTTCPYCSESVSASAKKCKHCGEILDVALREARSPSGNGVSVVNNNTVVGYSPAGYYRPGFPHVIHLIMTLFTGGLWLPVWIIHYIIWASAQSSTQSGEEQSKSVDQKIYLYIFGGIGVLLLLFLFCCGFMALVGSAAKNTDKDDPQQIDLPGKHANIQPSFSEKDKVVFPSDAHGNVVPPNISPEDQEIKQATKERKDRPPSELEKGDIAIWEQEIEEAEKAKKAVDDAIKKKEEIRKKDMDSHGLAYYPEPTTIYKGKNASEWYEYIKHTGDWQVGTTALTALKSEGVPFLFRLLEDEGTGKDHGIYLSSIKPEYIHRNDLRKIFDCLNPKHTNTSRMLALQYLSNRSEATVWYSEIKDTVQDLRKSDIYRLEVLDLLETIKGEK